MQFNRKGISDTVLLDLYKSILTPRLVEEKMLILLRQGKISKWFSGIGQEAISVGVASALSKEEYVLPMHRNLGVFIDADVYSFVEGGRTMYLYKNSDSNISEMIKTDRSSK